MKIFSIMDIKAKTYLAPVFFANRAVALRSIRSLMKGTDNQFVEFPDDYHFYELGDFDSDTGVITPRQPEFIGALSSYTLDSQTP